MESTVPARPETGAVVCRNGWHGREMSVTAAGLAKRSIETADTHTSVAVGSRCCAMRPSLSPTAG
jgi:hypothetical protein